MIVLSDSSPLITLAKIDCLNLLADLFGSIQIAPEVRDEVAVAGEGLPGSREILSVPWITVLPATRTIADPVPRYRIRLGVGELSTILRAKEIGANLVLVDDLQARKLARASGLLVLGCVGILESAFRGGLAQNPVETYRKLATSGAWIDPKILNDSLARLGLSVLA